MDTNVIVLGVRIGKDAEMSYTNSGTAVCRFSGAHNKKLKGGEERTSWFDFELWGTAAEALCQYLKKGAKVTVTCEAKQERWEKDGQARSKVVFSVHEVQFESSPQNHSPQNSSSQQNNQAQRRAPAPAPAYDDGFPDDIPPF